jgi:hypothetical protein
VSAQSIVYLYNQRQLVVLLEHGDSSRRYEKVYSKELTIHKGVDNVLEFAFVNQEQKPVDITSRKITCRVIDNSGTSAIIEKLLVPTFPLKGLAVLRVSPAEIENINAQRCFYSLEIESLEFDYPVFVDEKAGARGIIRIEDSVHPKFMPSSEISIPDHLPSTTIPQTYVSSIFPTKEQDNMTLQLVLDNFKGEITVEASNTMSFAEFYKVQETMLYDGLSGSVGVSLFGYHPFIRVKITNTGSGDVKKILVR